ncbi:ATP-binding protein [Kribbella deserti]|uniref:Tetratricopeptide repeat protein n=1 Tax=Kribbella deserti TaxID=1926257 RepID=A0ABV6QMW7_9ACTN
MDDAHGATFGDLLRRHRRDAGLSQEGLAERAGLSVDAIAALERGRRRAPRAHTLRLLFDALGLDPLDRAQLTSVAHRQGEGQRPALRPMPVPAGELVGRTADLAQASRLLGEGGTRLLTLTGPGGIGKTRLALATAAAVAARFEEGVCWIPLASLTNVVAAIGAALGLPPLEGERAIEEAAEHLSRRNLLLVLDNCEHLLTEVALAGATLLECCPNVSILATSRELLRIPGETVHVVPPLALPRQDWPEERLADSPAVQLFLERAAARGQPGLDRFSQVARVVRRLEGMPLAIELAAARTNVLTVDELASELEDSFAILTGGSSTALPRQQSLRAAIAWSHDLLTPPERELFATGAAFSGGWTLAALAAVATGQTEPGPMPRAEILDLTSRLVDKSLVRVNRDGGTARYDMLAVIREFAMSQLEQSGRYDEVARRHAAFHVALVEQAEAHLRGPNQGDWLNRLDLDLDNLRVAITWALRTGATAEAMRLAGGLWLFCYLRGYYAEGAEWLEQALKLAEQAGDEKDLTPSKAKALVGAGMLAFLQCEYDVATERLETALALYRDLADEAGTALVLQRLGGVARERGDYEQAEVLHRQSLTLAESLGDRSAEAWAQNHLGFVAWLRGDLAVGAEWCRQARETFRSLGDGEGLAWSLISLGAIAQYGGDLAGAETLLRESLALSQRLGYREGVAWSLNQLGIVERRRGRTERAVHLLDESLAEHQDLGDRWRSASVLEELATVARQRGRPSYAAFLLGAAGGLREVIRAPVPLVEQADLAATRAAVEAELDPGDLATARAAGRAVPLHSVADGYPASTDPPDQ